MARLSRQAYADLYGPTKGDLIRLGDTELFAEIEHDYTVYGHELLIGAGKNLRDGEGINGYLKSSDGILDIVIKNATIVDAVTGVVKADIGIRDGRIVGIGKAGNPDVMPGVQPNMVVGQTTSPVSGASFIVTAGAVESHAHLGSPEPVGSCAGGRDDHYDRQRPGTAVRRRQRQHDDLRPFPPSSAPTRRAWDGSPRTSPNAGSLRA
jgi:urease subunit alpha